MNEHILGFVRDNALFLLVLLTLVAGFVLLRTKGTSLQSVDEFDALVNAGQPTVVEFYSNT